MSHGSLCRFAALVVVAWPLEVPAAKAADGKGHSQTAEVAASETRGTPARAAQKPVDVGLDRGPSPFWIWGPSDNSKYYLKTSFQGGSTAARFKASCDNQVTIFLNGKQVAACDDWEQPVEADVQKHVLPGRNDLIAEVANRGGPAGFIFKLALKEPDGRVRHVISDASWTAAARREWKADRRACHCPAWSRTLGRRFQSALDPRGPARSFRSPAGLPGRAALDRTGR